MVLKNLPVFGAMKSFLSDNNITIINLNYRSFKLTIPADQRETVLSDSLWPQGLRVRDYVHPRRNPETQ